MRPLRFLLLTATLAASGCFAYVPSSPQELIPGEGVRLHLSAQEAMRYADLRLANPRQMEGTLIERSDAELMVETSVGVNDPSRGSRLLLQRVTVPLTGIVDVESRHLSRGRTELLVGGGAALIVGLVVKNAYGSGESDGDQTPDTPEARRIPVLRFSIPLGGR